MTVAELGVGLAAASLVWQARTEVTKRRTEARRWREAGPIIHVQPVAHLDSRVPSAVVHLSNRGRMAATITFLEVGAWVDESTWFRGCHFTEPLMPLRLEPADQRDIDLPMDALRSIKEKFPNQPVFVNAHIAGGKMASGIVFVLDDPETPSQG